MKLRLNQLEVLQFVLRELSKRKLPCSYHISYNLRLVEKLVTSETEALTAKFKELCDRDETGKEVPWIRRVGFDKDPENPDNYMVLTEENRNSEEVNNSELWIKDPVLRIIDKDNLKEYQTFRDEAYATEHELAFKIIPEDKIESANIEGELLMPLYGNILEEPK